MSIRWAGRGWYSKSSVGVYEYVEPWWSDSDVDARYFDCIPIGWGVVK